MTLNLVAPSAAAPPAFERVAGALHSRTRRTLTAAGDWPRTTRVLPWMLAAFLFVLWEVPFNSIQLNVHLPIDMQFDRLVLPAIVGVWVVSLALGGPYAPRLRATGIHGGVAVFVAISLLSVALNAGYLSQTLELSESLKKVVLLISYVSVFVMMASVLRETEVRAFMKLTLILAVLCAIGTIWEYRTNYNVFYQWSDKVLPSIFTVDLFDSSGVDEIGRRLTRGPAQHGLELATMLSMALPIAIVGLMRARRARRKLMYGIAAALLLAAAVSTYRKTAFLAPIAGVLTLAAFRRRELLRLAPFGVVCLVAVHAISPQAIGSIAVQLGGERLGTAATVDDRAADYDAIRPDVLSHIVIGRGYGSYEQTRYRILDSEILHRLIETGVLGLLAYGGMCLAVVVACRAAIRSRLPLRAPPALAAAAAAVVFLVASTLFDAMSFPHAPYIFLTMAGMAAVIVRVPPEELP